MSQDCLFKEGKLVFREVGLPISVSSRVDSRIPPKLLSVIKVEKVRTLSRGVNLESRACAEGWEETKMNSGWPETPVLVKGEAEVLLTCSPATALSLGGSQQRPLDLELQPGGEEVAEQGSSH